MKKKVATKRAADPRAKSSSDEAQMISAVKLLLKNVDKMKPAAASRATSRNIEDRLISAAESKTKKKPPCPLLLICDTNTAPCPILFVCRIHQQGPCPFLVWEPF